MGFINQHLYHWGASMVDVRGIFHVVVKKEDTGNSFHGLEDPII